MRRPAMWTLALLITSAGEVSAFDLTPLTSFDVTVRLYAAQLPFPVSPRALSIATTILRDAGVRVAWMLCGSGGHREATCDSPMHSADLVVRIIRCDEDSESPVRALGYAVIDMPQRTGTLATVYVDRVAAFARESRVDPSMVLGRAVAHEIGHLLMGTNRHSATGLMRAMWSHEDLRRGLPGEWRFTQAEMAAMRDRRGPALVAKR